MKQAVNSLVQRLHGVLRHPETADDSGEHAIRLAAAVLLVEMARADADHSGPEREVLRQELRQRFDLDEAEAQVLLQAAEKSADESVSLHSFVGDINAGLDYPQRQSVLKMLWQVAYADGRLHRQEEHMMRRFADLLHLSHSDFIKLKLQVLGEA